MGIIKYIKSSINFWKIIAVLVLLYLSINTNLKMQIICFALASFILAGNLDIYNPRCWFVIIFFVYSVSYPILYLLGLMTQYGCSNNLITIQFWGLVFFVVGTYFPPMHIPLKLKKGLIQGGRFPLGTLRAILNLGTIIMILSIIMIISGGFTGKGDLYSRANAFIIFALKYVYLHLFFSLFYWIKKGTIDSTIICSFAIIVIAGFASGERDLIFRVIVMSGLHLVYKGIINRWIIVVLLPLLLLFLPVSVSLKYVLMGRTADFSFFNSIESLMIAFFKSDFIAGSRNLQLVFNNISSFDYNGLSVFRTLISIFYSGEYMKPQTYFNDVILKNISTGYGLTIIGEGYLYGGVVGVALMMLFVGYLAKSIYQKSFSSEINQTVYLFMVPVFMYSCRGEIASILSPLFKYVLVGYLCIYIMQFIKDITIKVH